jgi:hypothetical protein
LASSKYRVFSHIIFVSAFPHFAHFRSAVDETHIRGCEYGSFAGFDEAKSCQSIKQRNELELKTW